MDTARKRDPRPANDTSTPRSTRAVVVVHGIGV